MSAFLAIILLSLEDRAFAERLAGALLAESRTPEWQREAAKIALMGMMK